jgi:replicative DNA helicase
VRLLSDQLEELKVYAQNPQQRIHVGIPTLDQLCQGPAAGEVYTILGRSYSGKSLVAQNIMVANKDKGCIFFSLEMYYILALQRLFSIWSGFDASEVSRRTRQNDLPPLMFEMGTELERQVIVDSSGLGVTQFSKHVDEYEDTFGERPAFVVIDYLELVAGAKKTGDGWTATESQAQTIKDWAKDEQIAVFLIHQTNKAEPEWEPPTMGSARGGGYTEADFVIGMWRPYLNPKLGYFDAEAIRNEVLFTVLKNRPFGAHNGKPVRCKLTASLEIVEVV